METKTSNKTDKPNLSSLSQGDLDHYVKEKADFETGPYLPVVQPHTVVMNNSMLITEMIKQLDPRDMDDRVKVLRAIVAYYDVREELV